MTVDPDALSAAIDRLSHLGSTDVRVEKLLDEVVCAVHTLFGLSGAGFMAIDEQQALRSVAASDHAGQILEEAQRDAGEGPCVDAFVHNTTITCADLAGDARYHHVGARLAGRGVAAVLGVPIRLGGGPVGSLNVYVGEPHPWSDEEVAALETYGQLVSGLLSAAVAARRQGTLVDQLQYALDYRVIIERAVGFLMARHDLGAVDAFDRLRRAARDRQRRVADVARDVLEGRLAL